MGSLVLLLRLRYRLLWAQVRLRNGKVALFFLGYLLVCGVAALLALGGVGAAFGAIRAGKVELVARAALSASFLGALAAAVVLGFGTDAVFSDGVLRRYPLSGSVNLCARHFIAILEPLWILVAAFNWGLAAGLPILGVAHWWITVPAALLLTVTTYLMARTLQTLVRWIMATRNGPLWLILAMVPLFLAPAAVPALAHRHGLVAPALAILKWTPPFAAAAMMTGAAAWVLCLLAWCVALTVALRWMDQWPLPRRTIAGGVASWDNPCDRVAAWFGPTLDPLIGKILRYYVRSPQLRFNYPTAALCLAGFGYMHHDKPGLSFLAVLGGIAGIGSMSMGAMTLNVFGFDGNGFRRYFLLPVSAAAVLAAATLVPLMLGVAMMPVAVAVWLVVVPVHLSLKMVFMLFSSGFGGMFLFQAIGVWVSLLSPRQIAFNATMGNKLSFAANATMFANMAVAFGLMGALPAVGLAAVMAYWWIAPAVLLASAVFYLATLHAGAAVLETRCEAMLCMIERGY